MSVDHGTVLVVCTGNVARSPYLERRLRQLLADTGSHIESAGTHALVGNPMDEHTATRLVAVGGDPGGFVSRQLTAPMVARADLVITAAREHRDAVARVHPRALRYTFTLGELADLVRGADLASPGEPGLPGSPLARLAIAAASQRGRVHARPAGISDVFDPHGRGPGAYQRMVTQVESELGSVVGAVHALTQSSGARESP